MARKSRKQPLLQNGAAESKEIKIEIVQKPKKKPLSTGAYIRLSLENSGKESDDTIQTQTALVESFIEEQEDLTLYKTYIDNGFSGTNFDRPEFLKMMEDVKAGIIQCIVVKDLSRFGRNYLETGYYLESVFPLLNVRFIAITDHYDSFREEDQNSLTVPIKNIVNAMYAKDFSRKQEAFREMCRKTGRYVHYTEPYGYVYSDEEKRLVIDKETEPYVRLVFAWTLAGISRSEIAYRLNALGAPTMYGKKSSGKQEVKWTNSTVKHILFNPVYAGFHVMGKSRVSIYRGIALTKKDRKEWIYFPDFHEAYITMDDYSTVENMIEKSKKERHEREEQNAEIREQMKDCFPGMVYCAECGRQMNYGRGSHHRDYSDLSFQYYRCRYDQRYNQCSNTFVQQNYLKIVVMDQLRVLIKTVCDKKKILDRLEKLYGNHTAMNPLERNISRLTEKERSLSEKLLKLYLDRKQELVDEETFSKVKDEISLQKEEAIKKRHGFEQRLNQAKQAVKRFREMADYLEAYLECTEFNGTLVKELVEKIIVGKENQIELVLNCRDVFENVLLDEYMGKGSENA